MQKNKAFKAIRPYKNKHVEDVLKKLLEEPHFQGVLKVVYPNEDLQKVKEKLQNISSIKEFQSSVIYYYLSKLIKKTITELSYSGLENLKPSKRYLFISNHRDIILDSALLNVIFVDNNLKTTEIAIGSNLLIYPWIEMLVKLNKTFVVRRNLPVKEMLAASKVLSGYMQHTLLKKKQSIWIAQKEGRTKDGNDSTHSGLLKMIHMSSDLSVSEYFKKIKVVPLSISYEVEPCDSAKTAELYARLRDGSYVKDPKEDLLSMSGGLENFKGRVHFHFGKPLKKELNELDSIRFQNDQYVRLAQILDEKIHQGYKLHEGNYIAYDLLEGSGKYTNQYDKKEFDKFCKHMDNCIKNIEGDQEIIKHIYLGIYANPLINKFKLDKILNKSTL